MTCTLFDLHFSWLTWCMFDLQRHALLSNGPLLHMICTPSPPLPPFTTSCLSCVEPVSHLHVRNKKYTPHPTPTKKKRKKGRLHSFFSPSIANMEMRYTGLWWELVLIRGVGYRSLSILLSNNYSPITADFLGICGLILQTDHPQTPGTGLRHPSFNHCRI